MRAEQKSLTVQFETIDSLISQNQSKTALKELKKLQKKLIDSWSYIGVYKRYIQLADEKQAEKILKDGLSKNTDNLELLAVYAQFLKNKNRSEDALKIAEKLKGSKYGSIYSELVLKSALLAESSEMFEFYQQDSFYDVFFDAYSGSKNPYWLKNCAVYKLYSGAIGEAAALAPEYYSDPDDAFFWSTVFYDAKLFYDAINSVQLSKKMLKDYQNKKLYKVTELAQIALESDAYMSISDLERAENSRQEIIAKLFELDFTEQEKDLLPVILINSAIWAKSQKTADDCADLLFELVTRFPDYVPGLIMYADFAYESNLEREEDDEMKALRRAGISSLEMERYDNRRKIPLSDALYRINESLKKGSEPYLEIEKLDLEYKSNPSVSEREKTRDLWRLLENNYVEGERYKELLVLYAMNYLLRTKQLEQAGSFYEKYVSQKYGFNSKEDFFVQFCEKLSEFDLAMAEFGAFFAAATKQLPQALRIYEYCVFESSGMDLHGEISTGVSTAACMNLADLYYANGEKTKALELYGKAAGREMRKKLRSEIFLRIANIYAGSGDVQNALRSADYACSINPENEMAVLLREQLRINK